MSSKSIFVVVHNMHDMHNLLNNETFRCSFSKRNDRFLMGNIGIGYYH